MRIEQICAKTYEHVPSASAYGALLHYNISTTGHDGNMKRDTSSFTSGCFDDFLKLGAFNIPVLMNHDKTKIVGYVNRLVSFDEGIKAYFSITDVRVFNMYPIALSPGVTCIDMSGGNIVKAIIDEISVTESPADFRTKVERQPEDYFNLG